MPLIFPNPPASVSETVYQNLQKNQVLQVYPNLSGGELISTFGFNFAISGTSTRLGAIDSPGRSVSMRRATTLNTANSQAHYWSHADANGGFTTPVNGFDIDFKISFSSANDFIASNAFFFGLSSSTTIGQFPSREFARQTIGVVKDNGDAGFSAVAKATPGYDELPVTKIPLSFTPVINQIYSFRLFLLRGTNNILYQVRTYSVASGYSLITEQSITLSFPSSTSFGFTVWGRSNGVAAAGFNLHEIIGVTST